MIRLIAFQIVTWVHTTNSIKVKPFIPGLSIFHFQPLPNNDP